MKIILCSIAVFVCLSFGNIKNDGADIESLQWIAGCWEGNHGGRVVEEQWMKPGGKTMIGMSRTIKSGVMIENEFLVLVQRKDGLIQYVAKPSGQEEASFNFVKQEGKSVVFENTRHDFPQRIIYKLISADSLVARIEGTLNGKGTGIDFPYRRLKCN
jgi:hypothetical protein